MSWVCYNGPTETAFCRWRGSNSGHWDARSIVSPIKLKFVSEWMFWMNDRIVKSFRTWWEGNFSFCSFWATSESFQLFAEFQLRREMKRSSKYSNKRVDSCSFTTNCPFQTMSLIDLIELSTKKLYLKGSIGRVVKRGLNKFKCVKNFNILSLYRIVQMSTF